MPNGTQSVDAIFSDMAAKYTLEKTLLLAVAMVESYLDPTAYRYEPGFWELIKNNPLWKDRDPKEVSASYGLMQLMYTTAWALGFRGAGEELYDPAVNIDLGAKLIRQTFDSIKPEQYFKCWPTEIVLARYNGGYGGNPGPDGGLRNYQYTRKVLAWYWKIKAGVPIP